MANIVGSYFSKGGYLAIPTYLKGDSNPNDNMFYQRELYEPCILIQVSSKLVEKWESYGHLKKFNMAKI